MVLGMRILGLILAILLAFNVVAFGHVDATHSATSSCSFISEDSPADLSFESETKAPAAQNSSSGHCSFHCFQQPAFLQKALVFVFVALKSGPAKPYSFTYSHHYSEDPFRPPLV